MKKKDYTNIRVGRLVILKETGKTNRFGSPIWECRCDCGELVERDSGYLRSVGTASCGCFAAEWHKKQEKDITGKRFGKLVAIQAVGKSKQRNVLWKMKCDCGKEVIKPISEVAKKVNPTLSCGCSKAWFIGNSNHGKKHYENLEKNYEFGTNLALIRIPDTQLQKNNTTGYQGVSYLRTRGIWRAQICFQGAIVMKDCHSLEDAIRERQIMRKSRDAFLEWYDSLSEQEQKEKAAKYRENKSMFKQFYKERYKELSGK